MLLVTVMRRKIKITAFKIKQQKIKAKKGPNVHSTNRCAQTFESYAEYRLFVTAGVIFLFWKHTSLECFLLPNSLLH